MEAFKHLKCFFHWLGNRQPSQPAKGLAALKDLDGFCGSPCRSETRLPKYVCNGDHANAVCQVEAPAMEAADAEPVSVLYCSLVESIPL